MQLSMNPKSRTIKITAIALMGIFLNELIMPTVAMALTSGPSQPEVQSFEPVGTSEMVDLFTGDFNYNIPLFELPGPNGGYPFNVAYHSGITMDQEASWVGLGWNLNPGAINRSMRGLPDDFRGEEIKQTVHSKPNWTWGGNLGATYEIMGANPDEAGLSLSANLSVYYNNYRGIGYSLDPSINMSPSEDKCDGLSANFGFSLSSDEGVGANSSLSLSKEYVPESKSTYQGALTLGLGFNSMTGLKSNMGLSATRGVYYAYRGQNVSSPHTMFSAGSTISFAQDAYTPTQSLASKGRSLAFNINTGLATNGNFGGLNFGGFFNVEQPKFNGEEISQPAYGYNHINGAGYDEDSEALMDFNRSKDGTIRKTSSNLAAPQTTYDYYTIQGQGIGGMFRPYRSEYGHLRDPYVKSSSVGGSLGIDNGPSDHFGVAGVYSSSITESGPWKDDNDWHNEYRFRTADVIPNSVNYEPVYYKVAGEHTSFKKTELDNIGGEEPVRAKLEKEWDGMVRRYNPDFGTLVKNSGDFSSTTLIRPHNTDGRMPRNTNIQGFSNDELLGFSTGTTEVLGEFDVRYFDSNDQGEINNYIDANLTNGQLDRSTRDGHSISTQTGGFSVLNPNGMRYVYGLPVYNMTQEEYLYSVADPGDVDFCGPLVEIKDDDTNGEVDYEITNTSEYLNKKVTPPYAHSHLITAIIGPDYVDADATPGPSDGDYGYWVKFDYIKVNGDNNQWRAPFQDANYIEGLEANTEDDLGTFVYGKKEVYHLARAYTKTHIAVFEISEREDARGPYEKLNGLSITNIVDNNNPAYKLDEIKLFTKAEFDQSGVPIQTVHFEYDYSLCKNVPNTNGTSDKGKLTLKKLWVTHEQNQRGALSPYTFEYSSANYNYSEYMYDRWGNYKTGSGACYNLEYPYTEQFDQGGIQSKTNKDAFKTQADTWVSAWQLTQIGLPTGGVIDVTYETDDYAYVQHREAGQMFKIVALGNYTCGALGPWLNIPEEGDLNYLRVFFKLEHPIASDATDPEDIMWEDYIEPLLADGSYQLYFKNQVDLRDGVKEFISGYADIDNSANTYGVACEQSIDVDGTGAANHYTLGFITLKPVVKSNNYHPFSYAAWQHMRTTYPKMLTSGWDISTPSGTSKTQKEQSVRQLLSQGKEIKKMFQGVWDYCESNGFASQLKAARSWMRLTTPDKIKYGGGSRVKKLEISDQWEVLSGITNSSETYGQVYEYTTTDGDGNTISSGVAQYEPMIGGDEIALRYAKDYPENIKFQTDNNLFFEFPVNESYFPGPGVGYSQVTVKSIASDDVLNDPKFDVLGSEEEKLTTASGVTVHEFYTAKDYPVLTDEVTIAKRNFDQYIPIPFVGQVRKNYLTASQGYSIQLNNMHGKPKSVQHFGINVLGKLQKKAISSVQYIYKDKPIDYDGREVRKLDNLVEVITDNGLDDNTLAGSYQVSTEERYVGVDYEFFSDMRRSFNRASTWGLNFNTDIVSLIGFPTPWPSINDIRKDLKTVVTNKIIHRSAILDKVIVSDGQSTVTTSNKYFDALTGQPLVTTVNNNFDAPIYSFQTPAHWGYEGMDAAYLNSRVSFKGKIANLSNEQFELTDLKNHNGNTLAITNLYNYLQPGDEFIMHNASLNVSGKATLLKKYTSAGNTILLFQSETTISNTQEMTFLLTRSGHRNHLNVMASSVLSLDDPMSRTKEDLSSYTAGTLVENLVGFLNAHLTCDGKLVEREYDLSAGEYYDHNGNHSFADLADLVSVIQINACNTDNVHEDGVTPSCNTCYLYGTPQTAPLVGYELLVQLQGSNTFLFHWHCLARKFLNDEVTPTVITGFNYVNGNVETDYANLATTTSCPPWINASITIDPYRSYMTNVLQASAVEFRDYWNHNFDPVGDQPCSGVSSPENNLYAVGKKGNWRAYRNYYYKDERAQTTGMKLSEDGVFDGNGTDHKFYEFPLVPSLTTPIPDQWIPAQTITKYNADGFEVENRDIAGLYSAAKYGYEGNLSTAVGANMQRDEMFFESFDDPSSLFPVSVLPGTSSLTYASTEGKGHTGKFAMVVPGNDLAIFATGHRISANQRIQLSAWMAESASQTNPEPVAPQEHTYDLSILPGTQVQQVGIRVYFYDANLSQIGSTEFIEPIGEIIEGWQKVEGEVTAPNNSDVRYMGITLQSGMYNDGAQTHTLYKAWDDIRIFPFNGNMQTYVYDRENYRLSATLDANNFATFYYYDEDGNLFLTKQETREGVMTIQESRSNILK